jgi:general secretion pathway protein A
VYLNNPALTRAEFVETLAHRFGLSDAAAQSKATLLAELEAVLQQRRARGEITALLVDEAQTLNSELLEEIRLLANIETAREKLLPLVLAGQPELGARLEDPGLRQLKQRVALRCEVTPFELPETAAYIASRIRIAGGEASRLFTREAVMVIHEHSRGIPRTISVICDNALVSGMALNRRPVDSEIVMEVVRDFHFAQGTSDSSSPMAPPFGSGQAADPMSIAPDPASEEAPSTSTVNQIERARRFTLFGSARSSREEQAGLR